MSRRQVGPDRPARIYRDVIGAYQEGHPIAGRFLFPRTDQRIEDS